MNLSCFIINFLASCCQVFFEEYRVDFFVRREILRELGDVRN